MNRQELNREIIKKVVEYNEKYPDIRFHQILLNLNIAVIDPEFDNSGRPTGNMVGKDLYNEEPSKTLKRMGILND